MNSQCRLEETSGTLPLISPLHTLRLERTSQEGSEQSFDFPDASNYVIMALEDDYVETKRALVAMTRSFKKFIEFSSMHDAYLVGQFGSEEWNSILDNFSVEDRPDILQLSRWVEISLRDSGLRVFPDELAIMFDIPEEQADAVLQDLTRYGVLRIADA